MQAPINQLYKFGQFRLDAGGRVLRRDGRAAPLSPKVFDTLLVLIETGDEPLGGVGQSGAGTDGGVLRQIEVGEALRRAQLEMLKGVNRRHHYYWASFIQSCEWANLEGKRRHSLPRRYYK